MTKNELIEWIEAFKKTYAGFPKESEEACDAAISALKEIKNYRKLGTLEELARADTYIKLAKSHGTVGEMIDRCAAYEEIGSVEEFREAVEKQKPKKPIPVNYQNYAGKIDNAEFLEDSYLCPNCKTVIRSGSYCGRCGQKLCWNENLEERE